MGSTRRTFFLSYLLVQALYNAGNYILLVLLVLSEKKIRSFLIAQDITVGKKAELIWPWTIRYGFPALLVFTIVSILFGTLWMYFGKVAGVILWILWMALCLGDPNIADAVTDAPDSILGRIGLGIAGIANFFTAYIFPVPPGGLCLIRQPRHRPIRPRGRLSGRWPAQPRPSRGARWIARRWRCSARS